MVDVNNIHPKIPALINPSNVPVIVCSGLDVSLAASRNNASSMPSRNTARNASANNAFCPFPNVA